MILRVGGLRVVEPEVSPTTRCAREALRVVVVSVALLFSCPPHPPQRSLWPQAHLFDDIESLLSHKCRTCIIHRALSDIPRVDVPTDHYDFLRLSVALDVSNNIAGLTKAIVPCLHLQTHTHDIEVYCKAQTFALLHNVLLEGRENTQVTMQQLAQVLAVNQDDILESIDNLCEAVLGYDGTTLFVSHDRHVVSKIATRILELKEDGIHVYNGTYQEYLDHLGEDHLDTNVALSQNKKPAKTKNKPSRDKAAAPKEKKPGKQKLTRELEKTTLRIEIVEHELEEIHSAWAQSDFYMSHTDSEIKELEEQAKKLQEELATLMTQWEQLEEDLAEAL